MSAVTAFLASIPSPDRGVWYVGDIPLRAYALCIIVGIIVAIWWGERRFVARGGAPGTVVDMAVFAVPFGLIGGRIYHVLTDWEKYFGSGADPVDALKIWEGGLGIWGAISFGAVGAWIAARRKGVPLTALADACAPGIVVAQAIGRVGNWFNQELYGGATTLPWGLEIFRRVDPVTGEQDTLGGIADGAAAIAVVHPTFLYELLWNLAVAVLVVWADRRFTLGRGRAFAVYVAGYTAGRFWIELLRVDPATMVYGQRINVITSVVVFLGAVAYLFLVRGPREILSPTPDTSAAGVADADADDSASADPATDVDAEADAMAGVGARSEAGAGAAGAASATSTRSDSATDSNASTDDAADGASATSAEEIGPDTDRPSSPAAATRPASAATPAAASTDAPADGVEAASSDPATAGSTSSPDTATSATGSDTEAPDDRTTDKDPR